MDNWGMAPISPSILASRSSKDGPRTSADHLGGERPDKRAKPKPGGSSAMPKLGRKNGAKRYARVSALADESNEDLASIDVESSVLPSAECNSAPQLPAAVLEKGRLSGDPLG